MEVRALHSEEDYDWALAQIGPYFDNPPKSGTPDPDRFDVLACLINAYEREMWADRVGRRTLTPRMMVKLHARWGVPAESLLKSFEDAA